MKKKPLLEIKHISKSFPGVKALDQVDFTLYPGEVHILAGENGAGKSTLIKCILGIHSADEGEIYYKGNQVSFSSPREAIDMGMAAVHQELTMIPYLTAAENIFFGREPVFPHTGIIHAKKMYQDAEEILKSLHSEDIPRKTPVKYLGVASQQMIEIAKALSAHPDIILFDEPTATLTQREVEFLFEQIRMLKEQGIGIIYVSHRMKEFEQIGDRVTVLRDGKRIHTGPLSELSSDQLTGLMVGRRFEQQSVRRRKTATQEEILRVEHLSDHRGRVRDCSFTIHRGEIVGISGLLGSGRTELMNLIYGVEHPKEGNVFLKGKNVTGYRPEQMVKEGLGFLPEDRKQLGLALKAPISWNTVSASLSTYFPYGFLSQKKNDQLAEKYVDLLDIAASGVDQQVNELSGGNQQKVVIGKWLAADTDLIIFDEPTRGVDIGAKMEIYRIMDEFVASGKAILLISSEMEEILKLSDRVYTMNEGRITGVLQEDALDMDRLGKHILLTNDTKESESLSQKNVKRMLFDRFDSIPPAFYIMIILMAIFGCNTENYFSLSNLTGILSQAAPLLALACGQTLIVLIQGTDLSLGTMMSLTGVFWIFSLNWGLSMYLAIPLSILGGCLMGSLNGVIVAKGYLPIFIVTLGMQNIFKSAALLLSDSQTLYYDHPIFRAISKGKGLGLTWSVWIALFCALLTWFLLKKTTFGMRIKGLGGNIEALHYSGSDIRLYQIKAFAYAGIMAAIGGLLLCCRIESGNPNAGNGMEFNAIAAVLLGGTSMREGRGGVEGTIFGVLLIQVLKSGLTQVGISSIYQNAMIGIVVLAAIIINAVIKNREERQVL